LRIFLVLLLGWVILPLPGAVSGGALAAQVALPEGTLSRQEVIELFSGYTVQSVTAVRGRTSLSYYAPDGELRQLRNEQKRFGHWRVTENGYMCLQMEDLPEKCRIIVREGGLYKKYIVKRNGQHQHSVSYRSFVEGNPYGI